MVSTRPMVYGSFFGSNDLLEHSPEVWPTHRETLVSLHIITMLFVWVLCSRGIIAISESSCYVCVCVQLRVILTAHNIHQFNQRN
jgi:hypothetical protein